MTPATRLSVGIRVFALGAIAVGVVGLVWDDFALVWQPVPAALPGRAVLAVAVATMVLAVLYALDVLALHAPRVVTRLGQFYAWSGLAEQLSLLCAALLASLCLSGVDLAMRGRTATLLRIVFGACLLVFGAAHFVYLSDTASVVPKWLPPGQVFWAALTGVAHMLAGLAIISGVQALLAARLLTVMFVAFGVLVHLASIIRAPADHMSWTANAVNLSLIGAAWVVADSLARQPRERAVASAV